MDACWEASQWAAAALQCMLMTPGVRTFQMVTGTHRLRSSSLTSSLPNCLKDLFVKMPSFRVQKDFFPLCRSFTCKVTNITAGPAGSLGAAMPAPQGSRVAVKASQQLLWARPRNVSWPQPQLLPLTGSEGGRKTGAAFGTWLKPSNNCRHHGTWVLLQQGGGHGADVCRRGYRPVRVLVCVQSDGLI